MKIYPMKIYPEYVAKDRVMQPGQEGSAVDALDFVWKGSRILGQIYVPVHTPARSTRWRSRCTASRDTRTTRIWTTRCAAPVSSRSIRSRPAPGAARATIRSMAW